MGGGRTLSLGPPGKGAGRATPHLPPPTRPDPPALGARGGASACCGSSAPLRSRTAGRSALAGDGGSSPYPAFALSAPPVPARPAAASPWSAPSSRRGSRRRACAAVWASISAAHGRPLPHRLSCRGADKDAAGGSRAAAGPPTRLALGDPRGRCAPEPSVRPIRGRLGEWLGRDPGPGAWGRKDAADRRTVL